MVSIIFLALGAKIAIKTPFKHFTLVVHRDFVRGFIKKKKKKRKLV
jgi:hypothetical protein